jgi:hypothetical protein
MVGEAEWVYGVLASGIYVEGAIRWDLKVMAKRICF